MAITPPLPDQQIPAAPTAGMTPMQFPPGTRMEHPVAPFPPELQQKLDQARKSGKYFITITLHDPQPGNDDRITSYTCRSNLFSRDWLLRAWQTVCGLILCEGIKMPEPPPPPSESRSAQG